MAAETAPDNEGPLARLALKPTDHVLEVGCGHGRTIRRAAAIVSSGRVVGLDPSPTMVRMAYRWNHAAVMQGRVRLDQGDAASLPYADASFDKVCATHTLYFWSDFDRVAYELGRVLKRDGRLVLGFGDDGDMRHAFPSTVYTLRSPNDVRAALLQAGFTQVRVESGVCGARSMHWAIAEGWTPRHQV
jgi:SAM-dependent methyltransferase